MVFFSALFETRRDDRNPNIKQSKRYPVCPDSPGEVSCSLYLRISGIMTPRRSYKLNRPVLACRSSHTVSLADRATVDFLSQTVLVSRPIGCRLCIILFIPHQTVSSFPRNQLLGPSLLEYSRWSFFLELALLRRVTSRDIFLVLKSTSPSADEKIKSHPPSPVLCLQLPIQLTSHQANKSILQSPLNSSSCTELLFFPWAHLPSTSLRPLQCPPTHPQTGAAPSPSHDPTLHDHRPSRPAR